MAWGRGERSGASGVRLALGARVTDRSSDDREGFLGSGLGPSRAVSFQRREACIGGEVGGQVLMRWRGKTAGQKTNLIMQSLIFDELIRFQFNSKK